LDDPAAGRDIFDRLTGGHYIEEFSQQPPTLDEIFRLKAVTNHE
jgi:ABC-2 type transport system ATP-binding protein